MRGMKRSGAAVRRICGEIRVDGSAGSAGENEGPSGENAAAQDWMKLLIPYRDDFQDGRREHQRARTGFTAIERLLNLFCTIR